METLLALIPGIHPIIPLILAGLGSLVVLGSAYVAITPTQDDDAWFAKLEATPGLGVVLKWLAAFSPIGRKKK